MTQTERKKNKALGTTGFEEVGSFPNPGAGNVRPTVRKRLRVPRTGNPVRKMKLSARASIQHPDKVPVIKKEKK